MGIYFHLLSFLLLTDVHGLIIPEELPSILSLVFANIPPVKKGTDSRIGFGFRLGEHADFQTIVELGPQKETEPIGGSESKKRRQIVFNQDGVKNLELRKKSTEKLNSDEIVQKQAKLKNNSNKNLKERSDDNWLFKWSNEFENTKDYKLPFAQNSMIQKLRVNAQR